MYVLKKGSKEICKSLHLRGCAKQLNKIAGFKVVNPVWVDGREEYVDRVAWINYKDYTLIYKENNNV